MLVTPTSPVAATPIGADKVRLNGEERPLVRAFLDQTLPFNLTGQPAISLPTAWTADGLPIGTQLVAANGREDLLLRVAAQIEQSAPWITRRVEL